MKKLILFLSLILFFSCDSMEGSKKSSIVRLSTEEILDVQNSQKDTVEIVINNKEGIVYIVEDNNIVGKALFDNKESFVILSSGVFGAFIITGVIFLFLIILFAIING